MNHISRNRLGTGLIAFAMVFAQVLMPVSSAYATDSVVETSKANDRKVFVCKYVGKPGVDEQLKEGKNPISVNSSATLGAYFKDGQDRSYVLAVDNTAPGPEDDPDVSECPAPETAPNQIVTPSVAKSVVCGPGNDIYTVPTSPNYTILDNLDGTYTLTAKNGFVFTTTLSNTVVISAPKDDNTTCPAPTVCTNMPTTHSTNLAKNGWTLPADAEYVDGGIKLNVSGSWDETYISRAMVGPLADIGNQVGFTASPSKYTGIHIVTNKGILVYEKEASYQGKWWSTSNFEVASGMGYATFDTLENIVAANPGVMTSELRVLYTSPDASSTVVTSVTVGCENYTFDKEVTQVKECPAILPLVRSTDVEHNGWTVPEDAEYIAADGGIKLNVTGNWDTSYIYRAMHGPLADIGNKVDFDATPEQYVGIHIVTDNGVLVYEKEASYDGKWWSTSDFGVAKGMGYATFDTLKNIVAANPDVMTSELRVLYTHPDASSSVITSVTVDCTKYVFSKAGGSGGGGTGETPVIPTVPTVPATPAKAAAVGGMGAQLPTELPMTGANGSIVSTWMALLAAILTYGAVFYLQPKKRFEQ